MDVNFMDSLKISVLRYIVTNAEFELFDCQSRKNGKKSVILWIDQLERDPIEVKTKI